MTADLIARLRAGTVTPADLDAAADALERADAACKAWANVSQRNYQRAKEAERKLEALK